MQNDGDTCCEDTSGDSDATEEAEPRSRSEHDGAAAESVASNSDVASEAASDADICAECSDAEDTVQCVLCYRLYCRQHWSNWAVIEGHERECEACAVEVLADMPTVQVSQV